MITKLLEILKAKVMPLKFTPSFKRMVLKFSAKPLIFLFYRINIILAVIIMIIRVGSNSKLEVDGIGVFPLRGRFAGRLIRTDGSG